MNFLPADAALPDERDADDARRFNWKSCCESRNLAHYSGETRISFSECSAKETFPKAIKAKPETLMPSTSPTLGSFPT